MTVSGLGPRQWAISGACVIVIVLAGGWMLRTCGLASEVPESQVHFVCTKCGLGFTLLQKDVPASYYGQMAAKEAAAVDCPKCGAKDSAYADMPCGKCGKPFLSPYGFPAGKVPPGVTVYEKCPHCGTPVLGGGG